MIDRYLQSGDLFVLYDDNDLKSVCVVAPIGSGNCELKMEKIINRTFDGKCFPVFAHINKNNYDRYN